VRGNGEIAGEIQFSVGEASGEQVIQPGLVQGRVTGTEFGEHRFVEIEASYLMMAGDAGGSHTAQMPETEDDYVHV